MVCGYEITIIGLGFNDIFLPVHFELGKMSKDSLHTRFLFIWMFIQSNIVLFDEGFISDKFFKMLTKSGFIFILKLENNGYLIMVKIYR